MMEGVWVGDLRCGLGLETRWRRVMSWSRGREVAREVARVERATASVERATASVERATASVERATASVERATASVGEGGRE